MKKISFLNLKRLKIFSFLKVVLALFMLISIPNKLKADSNIYESYAILNINGAGNVFYDLQANTALHDFNGYNLGTFFQGNSLILNGAQDKTYKNSGDNITDGWLYYRIYEVSSTAPSFTSSKILFGSDDPNVSGNQIWESSGANINVLNTLPIGNYYLEVYTTADYTSNSGSGTHYANNNPGSGPLNYKATFTVAANYFCNPLNYSNLLPGCNYYNAFSCNYYNRCRIRSCQHYL